MDRLEGDIPRDGVPRPLRIPLLFTDKELEGKNMPIALPMVTSHALDRFREHHPEARAYEGAESYEASVEVPVGVVEAMLARHPGTSTGTYFLTKDHRGILVVENGAILTYLRLGNAQREFAEIHWGDDEPTVPPGTEGIHPVLLVPMSQLKVDAGLALVFGSKDQVRRKMYQAEAVTGELFLIDNVFVSVSNGTIIRAFARKEKT